MLRLLPVLALAAAAGLPLPVDSSHLHDGPDPIGRWRLAQSQSGDGRLNAVLGEDAVVSGEIQWIKDAAPFGGAESMFFDGRTTEVVIAKDRAESKQRLPKRHFTIAVIASVNTPQKWGSLFSCLQDNGGFEKGLVLGYDQERFTIGLATTGADDGDGYMTYARGDTRYEEGALHHVVATYDGESLKLYVDGKLDAETGSQSGDILWPEHAPITIGTYLDDDERYRHHGRIHSVRLFQQTANADWIADDAKHHEDLLDAEPYVWLDPDFRMVVAPYLQWAQDGGITVCFETSRPSDAVVHWGKVAKTKGRGEQRTVEFDEVVRIEKRSTMHQVRIEGLDPGEPYYYRVVTTDDRGEVLETEVSSFQAAAAEDQAFAFAVISDTQSNPNVCEQIAKLAWTHRPQFVLHPGDLVGTGSVKSQWIDQFFASMKPLLERVPLFPVLGNHEQDARFYYDYMAMPDPEFYYSFRYGNAEFFCLDSNRKVAVGSDQYVWLKKQLQRSKATWKIVCYHHPAYSSDENDYGNTWRGPSSRGDLRIRALVPLFDQFGVDIVWNGHIHSYERTWPLREGRPVNDDGTVYMITGGGGGGLETPGPIRPQFQNQVRRGHHFCTVAVNGRTLEMRAFDLEGRLFDHLTIEKR